VTDTKQMSRWCSQSHFLLEGGIYSQSRHISRSFRSSSQSHRLPREKKALNPLELLKQALEKGRIPPPRYPKREEGTPKCSKKPARSSKNGLCFPLLTDATHTTSRTRRSTTTGTGSSRPVPSGRQPGGGPASCRGHAHHTGTTAAPRL
jgi:hypothetical protein